MGAASTTDQAVRDLAAEILRRPPYARWRGSGDHFFWDWGSHLWVQHPGLYGVLVAVTAAICLLLVWQLVTSLPAASLGSRERPPEAALALAPRLALQAEALAGRGRFLEAAHLLQVAAIDLLLRRGRLHLSRFEPNRTLRRRLGGARLPPPLAGELVRALDELEVRWFRDRCEDRDLYLTWRSVHRRIETLPELA